MNVAFIPIRCGSKSIPFKNIKSFCGKPLVYWSLKALEESRSIDKVYVATDCQKIKNVVEQFGFSKLTLYERQKENAQDSSSTESVMLEFLERYPLNEEDHFLLVQATSPLTESYDFESALKQLHEQQADSLLTCTRERIFLWDASGEPINYDYTKRPRRQEFDGVLVENGAFYINRVANILRDKNRLSGKITIYEMAEYKAVDIDEQDDWPIAEKMMRKYILKDSNGVPKL
jgi:N-acylneuraminate cytidylyltransferase